MQPPSGCSSRPLSKLLGVAALVGCYVLASCKPSPSTRSAIDVKIVRSDPRCPKIGVVEGIAGNERSAREKALQLAAERGATHVWLDQPHPDLEDGLTYVVTAKLWDCPSPGEQFPPVGYP